jgi:hypothetical protein
MHNTASYHRAKPRGLNTVDPHQLSSYRTSAAVGSVNSHDHANRRNP